MPISATFRKYRRRFMWSRTTLPKPRVPSPADSLSVAARSKKPGTTQTTIPGRFNDVHSGSTLTPVEQCLSDPISGTILHHSTQFCQNRLLSRMQNSFAWEVMLHHHHHLYRPHRCLLRLPNHPSTTTSMQLPRQRQHANQ